MYTSIFKDLSCFAMELFNCVKGNQFIITNINCNEDVNVSSQEIHHAIMLVKNNNACGKDNISAEHLKSLWRKLPTTCYLLYWLSDYFICLLVPIIKDDASKTNHLDNYRPIPLASILSKVLERTILNRSEQFALIYGNQFGFTPKHYTDMCISALKEN